ncbi:PREDICTED: putative uncharacterized protein FLJ37770 [Polistes dominula]|uniref:Mos1 transposase HTH domain-containing protein n=1 Tax=Polistes dominula TaxID=743375 RepID=A0ABM1JDK1_POLDO|nr:PREDICTED: putative uncharacterized protein FLJ37770 [Polistes dominula]
MILDPMKFIVVVVTPMGPVGLLGRSAARRSASQGPWDFLQSNAKEIYERVLKVYKDSSPSISTVERWVAEFKRGRTNLEDDLRQGRPKTATKPEIVEKIQDIVLKNRRVTERDLVAAQGISLGNVSNILTEVLGFKKLCAQWVPHSLTMEQKHIRMRLSQQHLERFRKNKVDFVRHIVDLGLLL